MPEFDDAYYRSCGISTVRGIGERYARSLREHGLNSFYDLIFYLPYRYLDKTRITPIAALKPGGSAALLHARLTRANQHQSGRMTLLQLTLQDSSGFIQAVIFNARAPQYQRFKAGAEVLAFGRVLYDRFGALSLQQPQLTLIEGAPPPLDKTLTPVYHSAGQVPQTVLRRTVAHALDTLALKPLPELLPEDLNPFKLTLAAALQTVHRPPPPEQPCPLLPAQLPAFARLCFEELCAYQISLLGLKKLNSERKAAALGTAAGLWQRFESALPFKLTAAQRRAIAEIAADLGAGRPMLRLLHGDVGSGKTVVAAAACLIAQDAGAQAVLLAPTELLARQHYRNLQELLGPLGGRVVLLQAALSKKERESVLTRIKSGEAAIITGTHSVFQQAVEYHNLALVIIDEQHRFGIAQRLQLLSKSPLGLTPHQLVMTATPIPRTQQLALYADLDVSTLDEMPKGRLPVITTLLSQRKRGELIARVAAQAKAGAQIYWVCPHIDEDSEEEVGTPSAKSVYQELTAAHPELACALLHGQLKAKDRQQAMLEFVEGRARVLVATTIVEVGVDVPAATIMIIDGAQYLGLAQLHQLRGRVGRGQTQSYCVLLHDDSLNDNPIAAARLQVMRSCTDGFKIAQEDLRLRGPGEVFGTQQKGFDTFAIADPARDQQLLAQSRRCAQQMLQRDEAQARQLQERWFPVQGAGTET